MFEGIPDVVGIMGVAFLIAVPLAIWKVIDIIIWLCHHVHFTIG